MAMERMLAEELTRVNEGLGPPKSEETLPPGGKVGK